VSVFHDVECINSLKIMMLREFIDVLSNGMCGGSRLRDKDPPRLAFMTIRRTIRAATGVAVTVWLTFAALPAAAASLQVRVLDVDGEPVPDVAVFVQQQGAARDVGAPQPAVMDQRHRRFVPHILVVQKGAAVEFPNSDVIAHHVYSFSRPNNFALPLYKGTPPDPVRFDHAGIVILGCNIHDSMLAYVVVVDTDRFGKTDADGIAEIDVDEDAAAWRVSAWSPRFRDSRDPLFMLMEAGDPLNATFQLQTKLRPPHGDETESVIWDDY
jgi:plastocyanin